MFIQNEGNIGWDPDQHFHGHKVFHLALLGAEFGVAPNVRYE